MSWLSASHNRYIRSFVSHPPSIQYVTEPGDRFGQIELFLPARRRPTFTIRSWPETLNANGSRRACRMAISRNADFFSSVHPSHHFVNQQPGKQVALTLDMGSAS